MVIAEEASTNTKESHDIDLKCAEKVIDSDNEENTESNDANASHNAQAIEIKSPDQNSARDFTCKPKPIKARGQNIDNTLSTYKQIPMYSFNSPKNPTGILPFQPTGEYLIFIAGDRFACFELNEK